MYVLASLGVRNHEPILGLDQHIKNLNQLLILFCILQRTKRLVERVYEAARRSPQKTLRYRLDQAQKDILFLR